MYLSLFFIFFGLFLVMLNVVEYKHNKVLILIMSEPFIAGNDTHVKALKHYELITVFFGISSYFFLLLDQLA